MNWDKLVSLVQRARLIIEGATADWSHKESCDEVAKWIADAAEIDQRPLAVQPEPRDFESFGREIVSILSSLSKDDLGERDAMNAILRARDNLDGRS